MYNGIIKNCDVPKEILIIKNQCTDESFVAKLSARSTIKTLRNRATCSVQDKFTRSQQIYYPYEKVFKNEGFRITIGHRMTVNPYNKSYKLIECTVEKDGLTFNIYFESTALLMAIKESTVINGVIQEELRLGTFNGMPNPVTENAYNILCQENKNGTKSGKAHKTTKYIPGAIYTTEGKTVYETFIGTLYSWIEPIEQSYGKLVGFRLLDKPNIEYLFIDNRVIDYAFPKTKVSSIADLCGLLKSTNAYSISDNAPFIINTISRTLRKNKLDRVDTGKCIDNTDFVTHIEDALDSVKTWILNGSVLDRFYYNADSIYKTLGLTAIADYKVTFTDMQLDIVLDNLFDTFYIEIDGHKYYGRKVFNKK